MQSNLRRGLLGTLFAGGLLAFGATAANAADTTSGPDLPASALVSAATSANTTTLGLLGGSTQPDATDVAAVLDVNVGGTNGLFGGNTNGSTADVAAAVDVNLGGTDGVQGNTDSGLGATVDLGLGLDTSGLLDETTVDVGGSVIIGGSTDSAENPGTTDPGTGTAGDTDTPGPGTETPAAGTDSTDAGTGTTDTAGSGAGGFTVVPAGLITGAVTTGAGGPAADAPAQGGSQTLAKTGLDASLIPLALTLMVAGVLLLRRRRAS